MFDAWKAGGWKTGWLNHRRKRFWLWVSIASYSLLGFLIVPWIARGVIVDEIREQLGLEAKLDKVEFNPYALIVRLKGFSLHERSGPQMVAFDEVDANLQLSSILHRAWTFSEIRIVHPSMRIEHNEETGTLNLLELVPPPDPHAKPEPASPLPRLIIESASIDGGRASVADKTERQTYQTELGPVDLTMTSISTLPNEQGEEMLVVQTRFGGQLEWKGNLTLEPLSSTGHVSFSGEQLAPYTAYMPPELKMVIDDGKLDVAFDYTLGQVKSGVSLDLSNVGVKLAKLGIAQTVDVTPTEWLSLDEFAIDGGRLLWPDKKFTAQRVGLIAPKIAMARDAQQRFISERLWQAEGTAPTATAPSPVAPEAPPMPTTVPVPPTSVQAPSSAEGQSASNAVSGVVQRTAPATPPTAPPAQTADAATSNVSPPEQPVGSPTSSEAPPSEPATAVPRTKPVATSADAPPPWTVEVARVEVAQGHVGFADHGIDPPGNVGISDIALTIEDLSLANDVSMPFTVSFNVDGGGSVGLNGALTAFPAVRLDAQAKISDVALAVANPYLNAETYLQIASGGFGLDGHVVSSPDDALTFDGELSVANLDVQRTDIVGKLLGWQSLAVPGLTMSLAKKHVDLARVELDSAYARVHISKDRVLNFATVMREATPTPAVSDVAGSTQPLPSAAPATSASPGTQKQGVGVSLPTQTSGTPVAATPPAADEAPWSAKLGRMKVTNADVDYTDESLPIPFTRSISKLSGGIDSFDTESSVPTRLRLTGQVGEFGEVKVSGTLRALDPLKQTNITASFKNLDMPGASAYAIRFAGHKVASGRLDVDMHYVLRDGMLDGDHKIVLRDFALGEKVDYPEALDLPYSLAISLLKDSSGNINVELPVEGNVNDPTFRIGGVIMRALANLITQIVTSPFRLLGRLVGLGDSEDFDQVLFEPGKSDLSPPDREKIVKVADALAQRPNLGVTIHGVTNEVADSQALRAAAVRARLDERAGNADAKGRLKILEKTVRDSIPGLSLDTIKAQFIVPPTPDAKPALDEGAYRKALIDKLVAAETLPPDALNSLATARATAVRDGLTANNSLDAGHVTMGDAKQAPLKDDAVPLKFELTGH